MIHVNETFATNSGVFFAGEVIDQSRLSSTQVADYQRLGYITIQPNTPERNTALQPSPRRRKAVK